MLLAQDQQTLAVRLNVSGTRGHSQPPQTGAEN